LGNATIKSKNDGRMQYGQIDKDGTWQWANKQNLYRSKRNVESMEILPFLQRCNLGHWQITNRALYLENGVSKRSQCDGVIGGFEQEFVYYGLYSQGCIAKSSVGNCKNVSYKSKQNFISSCWPMDGPMAQWLAMLRRPYNESVGSNNFYKTHNLDAIIEFICQHQKRCWCLGKKP